MTEECVTSRDGTRIGYRRRGGGPGLILVQGAMGTAYNFDELAQELSPHFTVFMPDRRGRGMSPRPYDGGHNIARDVEDIDAVLAETGASWVFGLSSGAVITLEAAKTLPRITRAAVYEPPFYRRGVSHDGIRRLNAEIERGELASALVSSLLVSETAPALIRLVPVFVTRLLAAAVLAVDNWWNSPYAKLRNLLPSILYDFNVVGGIDGNIGSFASVEKPVLLLSGTESPAFLGEAIMDLADILPRAQHVEFEGLGHSGSWNASRGGNPKIVAAALRDFFV